jgi:hypothetical protein
LLFFSTLPASFYFISLTLMTTSESLDTSTVKHDLVVNNAADLLLRERQNSGLVFQVKTWIKSVDSHLQDVFTSGKVIAIGHLSDEEHIVRIYPSTKACLTHTESPITGGRLATSTKLWLDHESHLSALPTNDYIRDAASRSSTA